MKVISKQDAKLAGLTRFFVGRPCTNGHLCERFTSNGSWVECSKQSTYKNRTFKTLTSIDFSSIPTEKITRSYAREFGIAGYFTGKACKSGHISWRITSSSACYECNRNIVHNYKTNNKSRLNRLSREYNARNPEIRKLAEENLRRKSPGYYTNAAMKRKAAKLKRTPIWADQDLIRKIYDERSKLSSETGIEYAVDHIIPLRGKLVSGLHVHNNLQILSRKSNSEKWANFDPTSHVEPLPPKIEQNRLAENRDN